MALATKRYRIEQSFRSDRLLHGAEPAPAPSASDPKLGEILAAVQDLKRLFDPAQAKAAADVVEAYRKEIAEVYQLRAEIDAMRGAIASTKQEIATLTRSETQGKGMSRVAGELDAVVDATEEAATSILAAVEDIETNANMLRSAGVDVGNNDCVGAILDKVIVLYEACNFQDLTGQRITKIVNVLKFVEERLDKMIDVWGGLEAFKNFTPADEVPADDHRSLLNGPKLEEDEGHVSQNDIDSLFD